MPNTNANKWESKQRRNSNRKQHPEDDAALVELMREEGAMPQLDSEGQRRSRKHEKKPQYSIIRQSNSHSNSFNPFPRTTREGMFKNPKLSINLDAADWSNPDLIIAILTDKLKHYGDFDLTNVNVKEALDWLTQSKNKVAQDSLRFRHPSVRAVECMLIMAYYYHADRVCRCMTEASDGNRYPCSRRRFCAFCSWRHGWNQTKLFLPSFNANKGRIHAVTLSWRFGNGVGIRFSSHEEGEVAKRLWDLSRTVMRALASSRGPAQGTLFVESLACTNLLPLGVNPHNHGLIACDPGDFRTYKREFERAFKMYSDFCKLSKQLGGLAPDLQFDYLEADTDFARWLNYCFPAFGCGRRGSSLDERYRDARARCGTEQDRIRLNEEIVDLVEGFDYITDGRARYMKTGVFHHATKAGNLRTKISPSVNRYLKDLSSRVEAENKQDAY